MRTEKYCKVCNHPERKVIDLCLADGIPKQEIASEYGMSKSSVERHWANHCNQDKLFNILQQLKNSRGEERARLVHEYCED